MHRLGVAKLRQADYALEDVREAAQVIGPTVAGRVRDSVGKERARIVGREVQTPHVDREVLAADLAREAQRAFATATRELALALADAPHELGRRLVVAPAQVQTVGGHPERSGPGRRPP